MITVVLNHERSYVRLTSQSRRYLRYLHAAQARPFRTLAGRCLRQGETDLTGLLMGGVPRMVQLFTLSRCISGGSVLPLVNSSPYDVASSSRFNQMVSTRYTTPH